MKGIWGSNIKYVDYNLLHCLIEDEFVKRAELKYSHKKKANIWDDRYFN